jgi:NAD(P)H-dependent FMN reductase
MTRIAIIVGSTRPERRSVSIAKWVRQVAADSYAENAELNGVRHPVFDIVDLAEHPLPFLNEPTPAAMGIYDYEHTKRWSDVISSYDGYIFVVPEYNHSLPAVLKNAIDYLYVEWKDKAAGLVTYGLQGGVRAAEHMRLILAELKVADVRTNVALSVRDDLQFGAPDQPNLLTPPQHQEQALGRLLEEVIEWSTALEHLRRTPETAAIGWSLGE